MATQLRIPPEQMRQRAASFTEHAVNLNQIIDSMDKLLKALQEEWEGDASTAFAADRQDAERRRKERRAV